MKKFKHIKQTHDTITAVTAEVMTEKQNDMRKGLEDGKDLMTLLLRANATADEHRRMSDEEISVGITYVQHPYGFLLTTHARARSTITFAGRKSHAPAETPPAADRSLTDTAIASTLAFALWELAKSPKIQRRVRDEVLTAKRDIVKSTGTDEIPFSYCEKMPLLNALIKVDRSFITNIGGNELTVWFKGDAQVSSGRVHGFQAGGRR